MPSHKHNTRRSAKPVCYYDSDSSSDYEPEDAAKSRSHFVTTSRDSVVKSAWPSFYSGTSAAHTNTQIHAPPTHRNPQTPRSYQVHPPSDLLTHNSAATTCLRRHQPTSRPASLQSSHKNCGWGHYDGICGLKIPLVPQPISTLTLTRPNPNPNPNTHSSPCNSNITQLGDDSGYASAIDGGDKLEEAEEDEEEESSLVSVWGRFKSAGKKGGKKLGRDYKVDGEGDCAMGGV